MTAGTPTLRQKLLDPLGGALTTQHYRRAMQLYCGVVAVIFAWHLPDYVHYLVAHPTRQPIAAFGYLRLPVLSATVFGFVAALWTLAVLATAAGVRGAAWIAFFLYFPVFSQILGHPDIGRKTNMLPIVLLAFALLSSSVRDEDNHTPTWPLKLVHAMLALMYLDAGLSKLGSAAAFWDGTTLRQILAVRDVYWPTEAGRWLLDQPLLCSALAKVTLAWELTFWVGLVSRRWLVGSVVLALGFHVATWWILDVAYVKYHVWSVALVAVLAAQSLDPSAGDGDDA